MTQFVFLFPQTAYEQAKEVHGAFSHTFTQITNIMMNNAGLLGQQLWTARKVITRHYCYDALFVVLCVSYSTCNQNNCRVAFDILVTT